MRNIRMCAMPSRKRGVRCDGTHRNSGDNVMVDIKLMQGDCLEKMKDIPDGSIDAIITDPPLQYRLINGIIKAWKKL